jgi:hypothetical protein
MEIELKLKKEDALQRVQNNVFRGEKSLTTTLYLIPEFIGKSKCGCDGCNNEAVVINDNMILFCSEHAINGKTKLVKEEALTMQITQNTINHLIFEWSVTGDKWYTVLGKNLKPENWNSFLKQLKNYVMEKTHLYFSADYDKGKRELSIY